MILSLLKRTLLVTVLLAVSWAQAATDFRSYYEERNHVNAQGDMAVIQYYHSHWGRSDFAVLDKRSRTLTLFGEQGQILSKQRVQVYPGDELEQGGAGIYIYSGNNKNFHYGKAEKDGSAHALFVGTLSLAARTPIYVLPSSEDHRFRIRNQKLTFGAAKVLRNRPDFNYSPDDLTPRQSQITLDFSDRFSRRYVQALQEKKAELMELLKLENDEYNMLAEFAFGVLSPETDFGKNWKYRVKQSVPVVVSIMKGNGFDTSENSRGPTQIKQIPEVIAEKYGIEKNELYKPENAAITTLAFVAAQLQELRNMAASNPAITEETLQDYLYYLYNGRRNEIRKGTATPDKNIAIQKIKAAIKQIHIEDL